MVHIISKITVFVDDQDAAVDFWVNKLNFEVTEDSKLEDQRWIEVSPNDLALTNIILYDKATMKKNRPDANVCHPHIIMCTHNVKALYDRLREEGVEISELMDMPFGMTFEFKDNENNPYLVRELR